MTLPLQKIASVHGKLYTNAEFELLPEFEARYELIDGSLVGKPG